MCDMPSKKFRAECHSSRASFVLWAIGDCRTEKTMNVSLWVAQIILAAGFAASGLAKLTMARDRLLETGQTGIAMFPMPVVRFTAAMEVLAAIGLVAPWLSGIATILTPLAAAGLCVVMIGAAWAHSRLREPWAVTANAVLFAFAAFVLVGRLLG
jgi:uncharacterized membrane protein YphA (DoxX/SURF4 family)